MENNQRNSKKRLNSLILLVAFTAVMLIVSTYAWFSAQKNVTIKGLEGNVNVAEGLMISLDAKNWAQDIDWANPVLDSTAGISLEVPYLAYNGSDPDISYDAGSNNLPTELLDLSATGTEDLDTNKEMSFYTGEIVTNNNETGLYAIKKTYANKAEIEAANTAGNYDSDKYPGFYAVDLYLQNSSKIDTDASEAQGTAKETLQLNINSVLKLLSSGSSSAYTTGLQNTTRVALAMYDTTGLTNSKDTVGTDKSSIYVTAGQSQILNAYKNSNISDIAIWEPNATSHTDYVVTNNNRLVLGTVEDGLYISTAADSNNGSISKFTATEVLPTFALTADSLTATQQLSNYNATDGTQYVGIKNIYDWKTTTGTGLERQIALQTDTQTDYSTSTDGVRNLVSITSPGTKIYELGNEDGVVKFQMLKNSIIKLRLYIWLEGQDPDTINQATHGGGVHLDLGLVKGAEVGTTGSGS